MPANLTPEYLEAEKRFKSARTTDEKIAAQVHQDFVAHLKFARVWGHGKFEGQMVTRDYQLADKDVVELHR